MTLANLKILLVQFQIENRPSSSKEYLVSFGLAGGLRKGIKLAMFVYSK